MLKTLIQNTINTFDQNKAYCYNNADGDTLSCRGYGLFPLKTTTFRVLGINCPEVPHPKVGKLKNEPFGVEATEYTANLCKNKWVTITRDKNPLQQADKYNRQLAYISIDNQDLGLGLLQNGLAIVLDYGKKGFEKMSLYNKAQGESKLAKKNIWGKLIIK